MYAEFPMLSLLLPGSIFITCSELGGMIGALTAGYTADQLVATVSG